MPATCWRCSSYAGECSASRGTKKTTAAAIRSCSIAAAMRPTTASPKPCPAPSEPRQSSSSWRSCCKHTRSEHGDSGQGTEDRQVAQRGRICLLGTEYSVLSTPRGGKEAIVDLPNRFCRAALVIALACTAGCRSHAWLRRSGGDPPPIAFSALPSSVEAVAAVNANTQRVQSLQSQGA